MIKDKILSDQELYSYLEFKGYNVVGATIEELKGMKAHDDKLRELVKNKKKLIKHRLVIFFLSVMLLFFFGVSCNHLVMISNGMKMPVLAEFNASTYSDHHFTYSLDDKTIYPILADNLLIKGWYWSLGDIFMIISICIIALYLVFSLSYIFYLGICGFAKFLNSQVPTRDIK